MAAWHLGSLMFAVHLHIAPGHIWNKAYKHSTRVISLRETRLNPDKPCLMVILVICCLDLLYRPLLRQTKLLIETEFSMFYKSNSIASIGHHQWCFGWNNFWVIMSFAPAINTFGIIFPKNRVTECILLMQSFAHAWNFETPSLGIRLYWCVTGSMNRLVITLMVIKLSLQPCCIICYFPLRHPYPVPPFPLISPIGTYR